MKFIAFIFQTFSSKTKRVEVEAEDFSAALSKVNRENPDWHVSCFWPDWKPTPKPHIPRPNSFTHPLPQFNPNLPTYPLTAT